MKIDTRSDRVLVVEEQFDDYLRSARSPGTHLGPDDPLRPGSTLTAKKALELFEDQVVSRTLDIVARELKRDGQSFYTISSAGHEQNAALGAQLRRDDPCFLHYRSGALMQARSRRAGHTSAIRDALLGLMASAEDPIAQGRHKVFGSRELWVPPQTSTIGSHLPKAVGTAFALSRAKRMGLSLPLSGDAIVYCSFGDASASHATALVALNAARYAFRGGRPTPILFVCEDNRIGISVETPSGWIHDRFASMRHVTYFEAEGEMDEVYDVVGEAIRSCRISRGPTFLRLSTVRLWGHAGSDVETTYRTWEEISAIEAQDPLLANAKRLIETGAVDPTTLRELVASARARVREAIPEALATPKLSTRAAVIAPLAPYDEEKTRAEASWAEPDDLRREHFGKTLPEENESPTRRTLAAHVNSALHDELVHRKEVVVFGEDVAKKGGVYGLTANLQRRFGPARVFDTLLDETTILGVAQGAAHIGLLPIPEIQYLAYVHNAIDQIRGEACSLSFFSNGQFTNPMVVRIAGLAYQKGFGGHFHNDNSIGSLREIPGIAIACPARGDDAARLLRGCLALAKANGRVVIFIEPIALYHERDLYEPGDQGWLTTYPVPEAGGAGALLPGDVGIYHPEATDLLIVSYANGLRLSLRAARELESRGIHARVLDLRWLAPLPFDAIAEHASACRAVLVADECRATGAGIAEAVVADLAERDYPGKLGSVRAADCYVPLGPASDTVLISDREIAEAGERLVSRARSHVRDS